MSEVDRIVKMLREGGAELQCAAAMVLGELGSPAAHRALVRALKSGNETLRLYAVEALGKISAREAAPYLVPLLAAPGRLRARIQQVLLSIGPDVVPLLQKHVDKADPSVRSAILEVLGQFKSVDLSGTMFDALLDKSVDVARQAAEGLRTRFAALAADERTKALRQTTGFLGRKLSASALASGVRLLAALREPASVPVLVKHLGKKTETSVRQAALETLAALDLGGAAERVVSAVLALLDDEALVSPAIAVLAKTKIGREHADRLHGLLDSRIAAVRLFAIQALGALGGPRAAEGLVRGLFSADNRIAEEAARALTNPAFAPVLVRALAAEEDVSRAWKIANVLKTHREGIDGETAKSFLAKTLKLNEKGSPLFKAYFEILRSAVPGDLRDAIVRRGRELMKKRRWDDAEHMLRLLAREDLATGGSDQALAEALLVTLRKDLATARLDRSEAVELFSKLIRRGEHPVLKDLERDASMVGAPSLLYLGFVLAERTGAERDFGASVLKLVAKKFGRSKEGATAKAKLKAQGV